MGIENLPKIARLVSQGWDLTVTATNHAKFHATVHLCRRSGPDSHHYIGGSIREALDGLERYIDVPESTPVLNTAAPHE